MPKMNSSCLQQSAAPATAMLASGKPRATQRAHSANKSRQECRDSLHTRPPQMMHHDDPRSAEPEETSIFLKVSRQSRCKHPALTSRATRTQSMHQGAKRQVDKK